MGDETYHLLGLAHVPTHENFIACAYTQKIVKLARMLKKAGKRVYFYGPEGSKVECDKSFTVVTKDELVATYGDYDWRKQFFKHDPLDDCHKAFNARAIAEISLRKREKDFLLCPMGTYDKPIADAVKLELTVESGIGYSGVFAKHRVWESNAWMHYVYGMTHQQDGSWYDVVIPNYWDPTDFDLPAPPKPGGYFLYIGRLISRKGLVVAVEATMKMGKKLIVAGQGDLSNVDGADLRAPHVEHIGLADKRLRAELMTGAEAVLVPTYYVGPFEGVHAEAMMCGTPVITTNWGVFTETVDQGVTGFRCRVFNDFLWAMRQVEFLDRDLIKKKARARWSMDAVWPQYEKYFQCLQDKFANGWYEQHEDPPLWV